MILKVKRYLLGLLNRGIYVYTFIKITIVFFGKKDSLLNGVVEKIDFSNMLKLIKTKKI